MVLPICLTTIGKRGTHPTKKRKLRENENDGTSAQGEV
jgi:hypothetical protein